MQTPWPGWYARSVKSKADDGVSFDLTGLTVTTIRKGATYEGLRARVPASLGPAELVLRLDANFGAHHARARHDGLPTATRWQLRHSGLSAGDRVGREARHDGRARRRQHLHRVLPRGPSSGPSCRERSHQYPRRCRDPGRPRALQRPPAFRTTTGTRATLPSPNSVRSTLCGWGLADPEDVEFDKRRRSPSPPTMRTSTSTDQPHRVRERAVRRRQPRP